MKGIFNHVIRFCIIALFSFGAVGCDMLEDVFEKEKEVSGAVEEVGADYLVVDANQYIVTDKTTFDGITGLADLSVGVEVEVSYEESGSTRTALEIETGPDQD